jgi:hypothetical protein
MKGHLATLRDLTISKRKVSFLCSKGAVEAAGVVGENTSPGNENFISQKAGKNTSPGNEIFVSQVARQTK